MKAFYAGSFDPFTAGHLYVVTQAAKIFDEVVIGIGQNADKTRHYGPEEMAEAIQKVMDRENMTNVAVTCYSGLTAEMARACGAEVLIRGLRNGVDYDLEENMALLNYKLAGLETVYFRAGETAHISASTVRELATHGVDVSAWVPEEVRAVMEAKRGET